MAQATLNKTLQGHTDEVLSVAFSPDNKLIASATWNSTVCLWNIPNGDLNAELKGHETHCGVWSVAFSPDGKSIVTGSVDRTVRTWSVATKQQVKILTGHSDSVHSVAWSPNGDLIASGSYDKTVILWDAISSSVKKKLTDHSHYVWNVSFSQNGNKLASAGWDKIAIIWDVNSGAALIKLIHYNAVLSVCFSPDDQFVVTGGADNIMCMFNANTGREEKRFEGHTNMVQSVTFSFDGSMIGSGSRDKSVRLWDVASTKQLQQLDGHTNIVFSVAFSCDGKLIASGSRDQAVCLWNMPSSLQSEMEAEQQEIDMTSLRECICCQETKDSSYLLPCLHAACSPCVADFVKEAKSCCSACGEKFVQEKLAIVPSNNIQTIACAECGVTGAYFCRDCNEHLCKVHGDGHPTLKSTKGHVVQLVSEVPFCHKHSTETALGFCTHCKFLICGWCGIAEHNKLPHLSVTLQEAAKITTDSVKNDVARLLEFVPSINHKIKKHRDNRACIEKNIQELNNQHKVETLQLEDLENTKALLLTTRKQASILAATAITLPPSTLVRLQSVVISRVKQLQTGLASFFN